MLKVHARTLSLIYHAKEDRMILLVNKDNVDRMNYWITRRFYFSLLFEFDTYLDNLGIEDKTSSKKTTISPNQTDVSKNSHSKSSVPDKKDQSEDFIEQKILLESVNFGFDNEKKSFKLLFKTEATLTETIMNKNDFLSFFELLKKSFPKGEWGII